MRLLLLVLLAVLLAHGGRAQRLPVPPATERAAWQTRELTRELQLTPAQQPVVAALNLKYAHRADPIIATAKNNLTTRWKAYQLMSEKEAELKPVLTPAQFARYQQWQEAQREKFLSKLKELDAG